MIYAPVLEKPVLELDQFFDLTDFEELSQRIKFAVVKTRHQFGIGISGPSTPGLVTWLPEDGFLEAGDARVLVENYFNLASTPQWEKDEWAKLRFDEQLFFTLMSHPAKTLCTALPIRRLRTGAGNSGKFHLKHLASETEDAPAREHYEFVMDWIAKQNVFEEIGRVQFFINTDGHGTPIHRDYADHSRQDQFIWIGFFDNKKFFVYDSDTKEKHYVQGRIATFDNHQWHGGEPSAGMGVSLRIDGKFNQDFLNKTNLKNYVKNS
jgi:hypothetical protein